MAYHPAYLKLKYVLLIFITFFVPSLNFASSLSPQGSVFVIEYDPWSNLPFFG